MSLENKINRYTVKLSTLLLPVFFGYLLLYPNLILHYSYETKLFIKYPIIITIIMFSVIYGLKKFHLINKGIITFIFLFSLNYSLINGQLIHQYFVQGVILILLVAFFIRSPSSIDSFLRVGIILSVIFSIQTVLMFYFWSIDYRVPVEHIVFQGEQQVRTLNIYLGNNGYLKSMDYGFRANSYFTEANRFGYFLTPSFFITYSLGKQRIYRYSFILITIAVILTFSFMSFIAIFVSLFLFACRSTRNIKAILFFALVLGTTIFVYSQFNDVAILTDKVGSITTRLQGIMEALEIFQQNPYGVSSASQLATGTAGAAIPALFVWLKSSGIQGILLLIVLLTIYLKETFYIFVNGNKYSSAIACGYFAFFLEQSFFGDYFEFYFVALTAVVLATSHLIKKRKKINFYSAVQ